MFMERRTLLKKVEEYVELEYNIENPKPSLSCALIQVTMTALVHGHIPDKLLLQSFACTTGVVLKATR